MNKKEYLLAALENENLVLDVNGEVNSNFVIARDLMKKLLVSMLDANLKRYNNNPERAFDDYALNEILNRMRLYTSWYLLDKPEDQIEPLYGHIRRAMNRMVAMLFDVFNGKL